MLSMGFDAVLKKSSALLAAMLTMAAAWSLMHLPGAGLQMVVFAFLVSAALCNTADSARRVQDCVLMVCGAAAAQFLFGITADFPLMRIILAMLFSFLILSEMPDRQMAVIVLLIGFLTLFSPPGVTAALDRSMDLVVSGGVVLLVTSLSNAFRCEAAETAEPEPYTIRQAAVIAAELTAGFIIAQSLKHEQMAWIMLTILFIHMAENPQDSPAGLVKQRIVATPLGILAGGLYLASFSSTNYRMIYIVPFTGTLSFFMLYLKNDYFIFTFLFIFTLTLFSDWMLGCDSRFHFADIMLARSIAAAIGGVLLLCGRNFMQKEAVT